MALQTTYAPYLAPGFAGMVADMRNRTVISREVAAASNPVPFGAPVLRGVTDHGCMAVGTAGAGAFLGIAVMDPTQRPIAITPTAGYQVGDTAGVIVKGVVWVTVTSAVTPSAPAFYDANGNLTATATGNTAIASGTFETTAASGGIAILRLA